MRFLSELTIDFIEEFRHVKGVGIAKYETVLKHFKEFEGTKREVPKKKVTAIEYFTCNPLKDILEKKRSTIQHLSILFTMQTKKMTGINL